MYQYYMETFGFAKRDLNKFLQDFNQYVKLLTSYVKITYIAFTKINVLNGGNFVVF